MVRINHLCRAGRPGVSWRRRIAAAGGTVTAALTATSKKASATDSLTGTGAVHLDWSNAGAGTINQVILPSTTVQTLVSGQSVPTGLAAGSSHIYWTNAFAGTVNE